MTGADHLEVLLAQAEQAVNPNQDARTRKIEIAGSAAIASLHQATRLIKECQFDVANDLIVLASSLALGAFGEMATDPVRREQLQETLDRVLGTNDPQDDKIRIIPRPSGDPNVLSAAALLELGVIDDVSEAPVAPDPTEPEFEPVLFGYATQNPDCRVCGTPAVALWFGVDESREVRSGSLCEACLNDDYEDLRQDESMRAIGNILFLRQSDPA